MQRNIKQASELFCATTTFFVSTVLNATGIPPINITLSSGVGSNIIMTGVGQTSIVEYRIQDVIGRAPARTWVWAAPIPSYLTRAASLHQPDCSRYNQNPANPNSFTLQPNDFCYLAIQVNGTTFASVSNGASAKYRPIFTNSNGVAYGPCPSEILNISSSNITAFLMAAGSYVDTNGDQRPLLVQTQNGGTTWTYPVATNNPLYPPTFPDWLGIPNTGFKGASCIGNTCIAAGLDQGFDLALPILAVTQNGGNTWTIPQIIPPVFTPTNTHPFSPTGGGGQFLNTSCSGTTCIAVGNYDSNGGVLRPLLALTQNSGTTWTFPDSITSPVFTPSTTHPYQDAGIFSGASCSGTLCIAAGSYAATNASGLPLLALSQNSGTTWTYPDSITTLTFIANPVDHGEFVGASCSGSTCVAVGDYTDTSSEGRPLLAFTQNSGATWTYPESITTPIFIAYPFGPFGGAFTNASCSGSTCVAVGGYVDTSFVDRPLLALSQDSGTTWTYPESITTPVFSPGNTNPFASSEGFSSVSCLGTNCVAVGRYEDTNGVTRPLLVLSQNSGTTWTYLDSVTDPILTTNPFNENTFPTGGGFFSSVTCSGIYCLAAGTYVDINSIQRPLLALSKDSGVTWVYNDSITSPVFTPTNTFPFDQSGSFAATAIGNITWRNILTLNHIVTGL